MSRAAIYFLLFFTPLLAIILAIMGLKTSSNLLGWFLFLTGSSYAVSFIIIPIIRKKQIKQQIWESQHDNSILQEEQGDYSFWLITCGIASVFFLSPIDYLYFAILPFNSIWIEIFSLGLVLWGIFLFIWARWALGLHYSGHIHVKKGQELIQQGPYHIIRHPAYAGYLLMTLGIALGYSSLVGMIVFLIILLPSIIYRIRLEDHFLAKHFGTAFTVYAQKRKQLLPGLSKKVAFFDLKKVDIVIWNKDKRIAVIGLLFLQYYGLSRGYPTQYLPSQAP